MKSALNGWAGKILWVDLNSGSITTEKTERYLPQYIGGLGIGLKIMWDETSASVAPYDPDNLLIFAIGPLTGTWAPGAGRTTVISKSPITYPVNNVTHGSFGGHFGAELKMAGYDAIVIKGQAKKPSYLSIKNDKVVIVNAGETWGKDTFLAQKLMIKQEGDLQAKCVAIGPAGERRAFFSSIISETGHANGQCGFGGVMGSKNIKGIVVRGTGAVRIAESFSQIREQFQSEWKPLLAFEGYIMPGKPGKGWPAGSTGFGWGKGGGRVNIGRVEPEDMNRIGLRCHSSFKFSTKEYHKKNDGCFGCVFNCYSYVCMDNLPGDIPSGGQIKCQQFGSYFPSNTWDFKKIKPSPSSVFLGKQLADMYAINSIELKNIRSLLVYLKNGHGNLTDRNRIELESLPWENEQKDGMGFIRTLVTNLSSADYREEGLWDILSRGVVRAADQFGVYADIDAGVDRKYKLEFINNGIDRHFDPRNSIIYGIPWAIDNKDPNSHDLTTIKIAEEILGQSGKLSGQLFGSPEITDESFDPHILTKGKAFFCRFVMVRNILKNSLTLCDSIFPNYVSPIMEKGYLGDLSLESKIYSSITGNRVSMDELDKQAEGVLNLQRAITIREWQTKNMRGKLTDIDNLSPTGKTLRGHDNLAGYLFNRPKKFKWLDKTYIIPQLSRKKYEEAKSMFYKEMGWDYNGAPTEATLKKSKLEYVAAELKAKSLLGDEKNNS